MAAGDPPRLTSEAFRTDRPRSGILIAVVVALIVLPLLSLYGSVVANHAVLFGRWYLGYLGVICLGLLGAAWGLWRRRRWGARLAWAVLLGNGAFTVYLGEATWLKSALPVGILLAIALEYRDLE